MNYHPEIQSVSLRGRSVDVLRLDRIHPLTGGNKIFKMHYNMQRARQEMKRGIVTFGGPHSNHIAATAAACAAAGMDSVGIIRGDACTTPTLEDAHSTGMKLQFTSRSDYRRIATGHAEAVAGLGYADHFLVPEGGANDEGIRGCMHILRDLKYDRVLCACGTGTTFAGLVSSSGGATVTGISVLKGANMLPGEVAERLRNFGNEAMVISDDPHGPGHSITAAYAFSGYACFDEALVEFKQSFEAVTAIPLDHVYTTKLFYAVDDLIRLKAIRSSERVLVVHSGGLQGNRAFEARFADRLARHVVQKG